MRTARTRGTAAGVSFATTRKERKDSLVTNAVVLEAVQGKWAELAIDSPCVCHAGRAKGGKRPLVRSRQVRPV